MPEALANLKSSRELQSAIDLKSFEEELRQNIAGEVRFDAQARALYATDASNYRMVPIGVVTPKTKEDVIQAVAIAKKFGAPILGRGAGTSLAGQCCNTALVLDFSRHMRNILELDEANCFARVEPGIILDNLRDAAEVHHLTFGPDPATHKWCTLGGMIGNNSCGVHSIMSGRTSDNIESLEILTYDGLRMKVGPTSDEEFALIQSEGGPRADIYRKLRDLRDRYAERIRTGFPKLPRRVSGFNLDELLPENGFNVARALVGTEGACVVILEATTKLINSPPVRVLVAAGFSDIYIAADDIPTIMSFGPVGLEGMDEQFMIDVNRKKLYPKEVVLFPKGGGWLLIEFGGDSLIEATKKAQALLEHFKSLADVDATLITNPAEQRRIWKVREAGLPATASTGTDTENHEGWEDAAVPPEKLGAYLREFRDLLKKYEYRSALYGHFGHGCVHTRLTFDLRSEAGISKWRRFLHEAAELVVSFGGSISGEHGDGQAKAELLPIMFGEELVEAFREFKSIWDPNGKMNPGKVVDPFRADENLRYGAKYAPWEPLTVFNFPQDQGSFTHATERCVGAGLCRKEDGGGTMCPSYRATHEERYATRGRARLLFEMMQGDPVTKKWDSEEVKESLDLCLACKACKDECPVQVDMATYKSEFLSHYYKNKLRPRAAYAMGLIHRWSKIGAAIPRITNFFTQNQLTAPILKMLGGIAQDRSIPKFANQTFRSWFFNRTPKPDTRTPIPAPRLLLWADTFTNNFHPEVAIAAAEVLESLGCEVVVLKQKVCCGRPLYDWGMLEAAKSLLKETLDAVEDYIAEGLPIVVLEPSCASVFKDELVDLFKDDPRAKKLSNQTYLFAEYLAKYIPPERLPKLSGEVALHGHCHQKALWKMDSENAVLTATGINHTTLETGCCGMAGAFGFETKHFEVSKTIADQDLLPKLAKLPKTTHIVTDGFSCREQVEQLSGREPMHLAELMRRGITTQKQ